MYVIYPFRVFVYRIGIKKQIFQFARSFLGKAGQI